MERAFAKADGFTGDLRDWFSASRGSLSATIEDISESAANLSTLSTELRHRPWRLLHSPSEDEALALQVHLGRRDERVREGALLRAVVEQHLGIAQARAAA